MPRRAVLSGLGAAVVLALLPGTAAADTLDPAPVGVLSVGYPPQGVARHPGNGNLYVSDGPGQTIHVYAGGATGSAPPLWSMPIGCDPWQITFNPAGSALLVACTTSVLELDPNTLMATRSWTGPTAARSAVYDGGGRVLAADRDGDAVWAFDASTSGTGTKVLTASSGIHDPTGLAYAGGTLHVASGSDDTVLSFAHDPGGATGTTPVRTLVLPGDVNQTSSVAADSAGALYVGAFDGGVLLYPTGAAGAATPARRLTGPSFGTGTLDLDLLPDHGLVLAQMDASGLRVAVFAPQTLPQASPPPTVAPGAVTGLKVAGRKTARKRIVTWKPGPAGTSPVTSYVVTVTKGRKKVLSRSTPATRLVLKRKKLVRGKLTVTVTAVSAVGAGPAAGTTFVVRMPRKAAHPG